MCSYESAACMLEQQPAAAVQLQLAGALTSKVVSELAGLTNISQLGATGSRQQAVAALDVLQHK